MNKLLRSAHRWVSMFFMLTVIANFVAMGITGGQAPAAVTYAPLLPLFILMISGTYLFVQPYLRRKS